MPRTLRQKRNHKKTRRMHGGFWGTKVAPSPETRKIESQFDIFIDKFNSSIADETGKTSTSDMIAYYEAQPEYKQVANFDLSYPYTGKKLIITYRETEEYSLKHDFSVCDIETLCEYIAQKRLANLNDLDLKQLLANGAFNIIQTILEKIGTDVTTDSVKRFMLQYIWKDTPIVKKKLDDSLQKFNAIRYTGGNDIMKRQLRLAIKTNQDILTGMLCVRVLIRKKFNEVGYMPDELNDVFGGMDASLFNGPKKETPKVQTPTRVPAPSFVRRCINGVCSILGIKRKE